MYGPWHEILATLQLSNLSHLGLLIHEPFDSESVRTLRKVLRGNTQILIQCWDGQIREIAKMAHAEFWDLKTPCSLFQSNAVWVGSLRDFRDAACAVQDYKPCLFVLNIPYQQWNHLELTSHAHVARIPRTHSATTHRAKSLMIQGTSSNAGKSVLTAAFGRILLQEGYKVAPFKAQNMSNNAAVTPCGGEIGRAQAFQASACGLDADVRMNPLLLKPESDKGSQIILAGKVVGHMPATDYMKFRPEAQKTIHECYDSLASEYDVIVLEGAGSPAEVNLRPYDLVNMHMAHYADASVLLVGDIDRGGIFASFAGTYACVPPEDQARIHGYLVNRFRGDASLLSPAYDFMLSQTGVPVLGTIPYIHDLGIPDEDAVSLRSRRSGLSLPKAGQIDIALIDIPHISNQSDFDILEQEADVHLRIVRHAAELGQPDAVILPGSKSVLADLWSLRERGLDQAIKNLQHAEIIGICGGLQMLGNSIIDGGVESRGRAQGLGLLDLETLFHPDKIVQRTQGKHLSSQCSVDGYEIHHGRTEGSAEIIFLSLSGDALGYSSPDRRIWGSYLHGLFDSSDFRHHWLQGLHHRKGWGKRIPSQILSLDQALDRLAKVVRENCDLGMIMQRMGLR